ncbi:MAG: DUF4160 domain-containing protein [Calothrix sp. SM1_5_4]|nr:DUF4160 domain-containing protein [Calothrix sp. SM1_5_4]
MPTIIRILGTLWIIHTRDHGHPHVTVYKGTPRNYEAVAKIRLDVIEVIESKGFSEVFLKKILQKTQDYQTLLLEAWNEIHKEE